MLNTFWNVFVIVLTLASVFGCWWLLQWTKGISNREGDDVGTTGHTWDEDLEELNNPLPRWWLYLFHATIVFTLVYFVLYPSLGNVGGILGWSQEKQYEEQMAQVRAGQQDAFARYDSMTQEQLTADQAALETGGRLFAANCAMCHGSDGGGAPGFPDLTDDDWLYGGDFDTIYATLENGRTGVMPALGASLGEEGVEQVVAYVLSLSGEEENTALVSAGEQKFGMFCAACHGADAGGNQALGAPNLSDDIWLYGAGAESVTEAIMNGRSGNMPAFGEQFSDAQLRLLAAYVMSLSSQ